MARGNQRDKAREKNLKAQAGVAGQRTEEIARWHDNTLRFRWFVCNAAGSGEITDHMMPSLQKNKNTKSGTEMQRNKDSVAEIMKKKQQAADERKAAEAAAGKK
ncbi:hypothetical protein LQW54_005972 [Pestalotiopsis sp. IQ-011]